MMLDTGIPIYWDRSDRVRFEVKSYVSKSRAVLDRERDKAANGTAKNYGKVFYAEPHVVGEGMLPTLQEFLAEQEAKRKNQVGNLRVKDNTPFSNADWTPPED